MSNESFNSILQSYQSISDFLKSYDFNTILSYIAHATGKKKHNFFTIQPGALLSLGHKALWGMF